LCTDQLGSDSRQLAACDSHGQQESAGEDTSGKTQKGNRWLRTTLTEAALAAIRVKDSRQAARYCRLMRHWGHKKAVVAVAHTILVIVYHLLKDHVSYMEIWGPVSRAAGSEARYTPPHQAVKALTLSSQA
jgi:hypothetical protein